MSRISMAIVLASALAGTAGTGKFIVEVNGIKIVKGTIMLALVDKEELFLTDKQPLKALKLPVKDKSARFVIDSLAYGEYAVSVYQDENDNGKLDTRLFIIPKEPYGISNNAPSKYGPPKYAQAKFQLGQDSLKKEIKLQ